MFAAAQLMYRTPVGGLGGPAPRRSAATLSHRGEYSSLPPQILPGTFEMLTGADYWRNNKRFSQEGETVRIRIEIRMKLYWDTSIRECVAAADLQVALDCQPFSQQQVMLWQFDVVIIDAIDIELRDRAAVRQILDRDQHILGEHRVVR